MRNVMAVDPKWLVELAPKFFKAADPHKLTKAKRMQKIEPLYDRCVGCCGWWWCGWGGTWGGVGWVNSYVADSLRRGFLRTKQVQPT